LDGRELRRRRLALGWTQADHAKRLEVAPNTVARWERGERGIAHPAMLSAMLDVIEAQADTRTAETEAVHAAGYASAVLWEKSSPPPPVHPPQRGGRPTACGLSSAPGSTIRAGSSPGQTRTPPTITQGETVLV
jgi:hypothetical protein